MARVRLIILAALSIALWACGSAFANGDHKHSHRHAAKAHRTQTSRGARCRRYARKHPGTHCGARKHQLVIGRRAKGHHGKRHNPRGHEGVSGVQTTRRPITPAAAHAGSCPGADLRPEATNLERIRSATLCLINQQRALHGLRALQANGQLQQAAQAHTTEMAFGNYFEHTGPHGDTPLSRIRSSGYIYNHQIGYEIGENIAWGTLSLATPRAIVQAWINSPEHLANILNGHYRDTAIGVSPHVPSSLAHGQAGGIYTEDFGVIITG